MILRFGHIFVAVFALILQIYLHISFFCCTFAPAKSVRTQNPRIVSAKLDRSTPAQSVAQTKYILISITIISYLPKASETFRK